MRKKIVIAGGTGFIGSYFVKRFDELGYDVKVISRQSGYIPWDDHKAVLDALEDSEMLINLAGKSVNCRYHAKNKAEILRSRIETTKQLGEALLKCKNPPPVWMNASTATIYHHTEDRPMTEEKGELGCDFSMSVAREWERAFFSFQLPHTRQIALRMAIVLGEGSVVPLLKNLAQLGLGGKQGSGNQMVSWIHIEDLFQILLFLHQKKELNGIFNCSAPYPIPNREFMKCFRDILNVRIGLPSPEWIIEIGTFLLRTESELVLKSRWVLPEKLEKEGYVFHYDRVEKALQHILRTNYI